MDTQFLPRAAADRRSMCTGYLFTHGTAAGEQQDSNLAIALLYKYVFIQYVVQVHIHINAQPNSHLNLGKHTTAKSEMTNQHNPHKAIIKLQFICVFFLLMIREKKSYDRYQFVIGLRWHSTAP